MKLVKSLLAFAGFFTIYGLADFIGGHLPEWAGYVLLLSAIAGLIALMFKIAQKGN